MRAARRSEGLENVLITNLVLNTAQAHFNEHLAESLPQGHRITFGGVTASIVIGLAMQDTGENALEEVAWTRCVFACRCCMAIRSTLSPKWWRRRCDAIQRGRTDVARTTRGVGVVHFRHWGVNQRGETVFEGERRVIVKKRAFSLRARGTGRRQRLCRRWQSGRRGKGAQASSRPRPRASGAMAKPDSHA